MKKIYIVLQDGHVFEGKSFGAEGETLGELVFTTGMNGYIATLTDPSYYGQIIMQTFPLIGNYGTITEAEESKKIWAKGYVVREWCDNPSNFRNEGTIDELLKKQNIVGICGVDTREITQIIREHGVMNAKIVCNPDEVNIDEIKNYRIKDSVQTVTTEKAEIHKSENCKHKVVLIDYGAKNNIVRELVKRNCDVICVPSSTPKDEIVKMNPDGIMLSNGPGDPEDNTFEIEQIKGLIGKYPIFGICLGHQLLALAVGGKTSKLKYGHRGVNQPVKNLHSGRTYVSCQNHGYAVEAQSVEQNGGKVSFVNANDGTCEGVDYPELNAFSVQFHPEACSGPKDTELLFDRFIKMMEGDCNAAE